MAVCMDLFFTITRQTATLPETPEMNMTRYKSVRGTSNVFDPTAFGPKS